ncbi:hypothetical protein LIER_00853 [Lithospermum erythrorhizon]|uniref:Reverse transcriptase domain-containing protein n=1 Tax=Lithospermum erythrorhizon TaxID=34254 RepID=A0AAV3NKB6_LITER
MDKEHNPQDRPGVRTRARSSLAPIANRGAPIAPNREPSKTPRLPRMAPAQQARAHSDDPRPSPGMLHPRERYVTRGQGEVRAPMGPRQNLPHHLAVSVGIHNPPIQISEHERGRGKHTRRRREQSLSEDAHTREFSYRHGYDLTPSKRSPAIPEVTSTRGSEDPRRHSDPFGTHYTPLRVPVGKIYAQIEEKKFLPRPQKIKPPPHPRDLKKYCEYHKDHGRDTDDCQLLKAEIDKLIKRGQLREFVRKDQMESPRRYREPSLGNTLMIEK